MKNLSNPQDILTSSLFSIITTRWISSWLTNSDIEHWKILQNWLQTISFLAKWRFYSLRHSLLQCKIEQPPGPKADFEDVPTFFGLKKMHLNISAWTDFSLNKHHYLLVSLLFSLIFPVNVELQCLLYVWT